MKKHRRHKTVSSAIKLKKLKHKAIWLHGNNCLKCGSYKNLELDHIKPAVYYPELFHKFYNVQILCKSCNLKKRTNECDYREDSKKYELLDKETIKDLDFYYKLHLSKYPIKENIYLRKLLKTRKNKKI